jgi:hypothetical protein
LTLGGRRERKANMGCQALQLMEQNMVEILGDHKGEWYKDVVKEKQESCVRKKAKSWLGSFIDNSLLN